MTSQIVRRQVKLCGDESNRVSNLIELPLRFEQQLSVSCIRGLCDSCNKKLHPQNNIEILRLLSGWAAGIFVSNSVL